MTNLVVKDRMARAIAAVILRSLGDEPESSKYPVMADRRRVAEEAADAAIASILPGDSIAEEFTGSQRENWFEATDSSGQWVIIVRSKVTHLVSAGENYAEVHFVSGTYVRVRGSTEATLLRL